MSVTLSKRVQSIGSSPTLAVAAKAKELKSKGQHIVNLSAGEPDFDTPLSIKAAGIAAIHEGKTKYTAVAGTNTLKKAIIKKFHKQNNLDYSLTEVMAATGAKQAIINAMLAILNQNDEVIIPAPYWTSYPDMCKLVEANPVIIQAKASNNFKMTAAELEKAITKKTRMLILNSPSNPSGMIYNSVELAEIAKVLLKHPEIIIISDDIYEHIIWPENQFVNIINVCPQLKERTIIINGVSKTYAMTGWRLGYAAGAEPIISAMTKIQSQTTSSPSSISQAAAAEALETSHEAIKEMIDMYHCRYKFAYEAVQLIPGISVKPSNGSFYMLLDTSELIKDLGLNDDTDLAEFLLDKAKVSVVPGSAFGAKNHVRISFANCKKELQLGFESIKKVISEKIK